MNTLELDHVFFFCSADLPEVETALKHGFNLTKGTVHKGQGTANRSILFHRNYLELIYISSKAEAANNPLRLDRRADWRKTGACPFGIGLRGTLNAKAQEDFWEYSPPYWPSAKILIHKSNELMPQMPLLFLVQPRDGSAGASMHPKNWQGVDDTLFCHKNSSTDIRSVTVTVPNLRWPLGSSVPSIKYVSGNEPFLQVELKAESVFQFELGNIVRVIS